jgi:hypothetical protein
MMTLVAILAHLKCIVVSARVNGDSPARTCTQGTTATIDHAADRDHADVAWLQ